MEYLGELIEGGRDKNEPRRNIHLTIMTMIN